MNKTELNPLILNINFCVYIEPAFNTDYKLYSFEEMNHTVDLRVYPLRSPTTFKEFYNKWKSWHLTSAASLTLFKYPTWLSGVNVSPAGLIIFF